MIAGPGVPVHLAGRHRPAIGCSARTEWPVAVVSMPFAPHHITSIQLGLLKSIVTERGFPVVGLPLNLDFAAAIGERLYELVANDTVPLLGDWLFSTTAFGDDAPDPEGRFLADFRALFDGVGDEATDQANRVAARLLGRRSEGRDWLESRPFDPSCLQRVRTEVVPNYIERILATERWAEVRVVAFTCTWEQAVASFALAAALKREFPTIVTVFGGAKFDGEMGPELVRSMGCIDFAVRGEGDRALPELLDTLAAGDDPRSVRGVIGRNEGWVWEGPTSPLVEPLDRLPVPDHTDYVERASRLGLPRRRRLFLSFEGARGCWWGARRQCTFCGLEPRSMRYRSKSPERLLAELAELAERHGTTRFVSVDAILEPTFVDTLFPRLAEREPPPELFWEVKSDLGRRGVEALAAGGVRIMQPGIESLSSRVLALMRKGARAGQNVDLLRWTAHAGVSALWNLLWGFPGETAEDYAEQAALIPLLAHLQPPQGAGRISLDRFSPYFEGAASFPCSWRRPQRAYAYVYPADIDLARVAFRFEYEPESGLAADAYEPVSAAVQTWRAAWQHLVRPTMTWTEQDGRLVVDDRRLAEAHRVYTLEGLLAAVYRSGSDGPRTAAQLATDVGCRSPGAAEAAAAELVERGLMMRDRRLYLSLALPAPSTA